MVILILLTDSTSFIEEALQWVAEDANEQIENAKSVQSDDKQYIKQSRDNFQEAATIGLEAMHRANSTLEDFCRSGFMFHKMDVHRLQLIFRYLPILSFRELFYQLDTLNEKLLQSPTYEVQL